MPNARSFGDAASRRTRSLRGSLLIGLLVVSTLWALGAPFVTISLNESRLQGIAKDRTQTLAVAEAGVEQAIWEFNHHGGVFSGWGSANSVLGCTTGDCVQQLGYVVGTSGTADILVDGVGAANLTPSVRSTGQNQGSVAKTTVTVTLQKNTASGFPYAAFAMGAAGAPAISIQSAGATDSYDSAVGPYDPFSYNQRGDIATNLIGANSIYIFTGTVNGNGYVGPSGNPSTDINISMGIGTLTGIKDKLSSTIPLAPVSMPGSCSPLGALVLDSTDADPANDTQLLSAGVIYCADSILLKGASAKLHATDPAAPVKIYVRNWIRVEGSQIVPANGSGGFPVPEKMQVYLASGGSDIPSSGSACDNLRFCSTETFPSVGPTITATLYGADAKVLIGSRTKFYGAVAAEKVTIGGTGGAFLHYDEHLKHVTTDYTVGSSGGVTVTSWTRQNGN